MSSLDTRKKIGQFFMIGFDGFNPSENVISLLEKDSVGWGLLFRNNCPSVGITKELIASLKSHVKGLPFCVAIDHEGGRVHRLPKPVTHFPPMSEVGKVYEKMPSSQLAYEIGKAMGNELKAIGIDFDFAPVADVNTNVLNPVIGDRSFSNNPQTVAIAVEQVVRGLQDVGVAACAKHFPGHGDTDLDSHELLPKLNHNIRRLEKLELVPFRKAIETKVASIMTAHVVYNGLDQNTIATLSVKILRDLLREQMGFAGMIVSDDLSMGAIAKNIPLEEACVLAFLAGCDLLIVGKNAEAQKRAIEYFVKAVEKKRIPIDRVEESYQRIQNFKSTYCGANQERPPMKVIGSKEHQSLLHRISTFA